MPEAERWRSILVAAAAAAWLGLGLFIAALANGGYGYLARVGVLEQLNYREFVAVYCSDATVSTKLRPLGCWCMSTPSESGPATAPDRDYLFDASGGRLLPKLAKEAWLAGFLALSVFFLATGQARLPRLANARPLLILVALVVFAAAVSAILHGAMQALPGLRPFEFLAIAGLGGWAVSRLPQAGKWLAWLLLAELVSVGVELLVGLPLRSCPNSFRAAGTMVLPNTLGIVAVAAFTFVFAFVAARKWLPGLALVVAALVLASGSGTGVVMLFALLVVAAFRFVPERRVRIAVTTVVLLAVLLAAGLPVLTKRPGIYDSLFASGGRVDKAMQVVRQNSLAQDLFGRGLGKGTNLSTNLRGLAVPGVGVEPVQEQPFYTDSTVTFLLVQLGFAGVLAFYSVLAWSWWRDLRARPFYLVVALASLTVNIPEVFPVNFLLGLALAHTLALAGSRQPTAVPA